MMLADYLSAHTTPRAVRNQQIRELMEADRNAVLSLLAGEPLRGVQLRSLIEDNGVSHPSNRGRFYGYFENEVLLGVALLGHAIMFYACPEVELEAIACFAKTIIETNVPGNVMFGPRNQVEALWLELANLGRTTKMVRAMRSLVCRKAKLPMDSLNLTRANPDELEAISIAHAEMFIEATGTDPRIKDPEGFRTRVAERIGRKRTWIKMESGEVVFKTELQSLTAEVVYLEGIWTKKEMRSKGIAKKCLNELVHRLLRQHQAISLVVEADEEIPYELYQQVGFMHVEDYQARYLNPLESSE